VRFGASIQPATWSVVIPSTAASYSVSAVTSTEWLMPSDLDMRLGTTGVRASHPHSIRFAFCSPTELGNKLLDSPFR
jgi:hypothetical protein